MPEQFRHAPASLRAAQLPGASGGVAFLKTFGKPDRLSTCECERSESTTLAQAFQMINGETVRKKMEMASNRIGRYLKGNVRIPRSSTNSIWPRWRGGRLRSSDRPSPRISRDQARSARPGKMWFGALEQ